MAVQSARHPRRIIGRQPTEREAAPSRSQKRRASTEDGRLKRSTRSRTLFHFYFACRFDLVASPDVDYVGDCQDLAQFETN
jgi:hypothetical protein